MTDTLPLSNVFAKGDDRYVAYQRTEAQRRRALGKDPIGQMAGSYNVNRWNEKRLTDDDTQKDGRPSRTELFQTPASAGASLCP